MDASFTPNATLGRRIVSLQQLHMKLQNVISIQNFKNMIFVLEGNDELMKSSIIISSRFNFSF